MNKGKTNEKRPHRGPIAPEQAEERLKILLEQRKEPGKMSAFIKRAGGPGIDAALALLMGKGLTREDMLALAEALSDNSSEAAEKINQLWLEMEPALQKILLEDGLPKGCLPCFEKAASSDDPTLHLYGLIHLAGLDRLEASEPLLDCLASPHLLPHERGMARLYLTIIYRRHGAAAFPTLWDAAGAHFNRLYRIIPKKDPDTGRRWLPMEVEGHMAAVAPHLADPEPELRRRAVELAVPERVSVEQWRGLLADTDMEVRGTAADIAPPDPLLQDLLLAILCDESAGEETRVTISERSDLPPERVLSCLAEQAVSTELDIDTRLCFTGKIIELLEQGTPAPDLQTLRRSLLAEDDFRFRRQGYDLKRLEGMEPESGRQDALLLELLALPAEGASEDIDRIAAQLAVYGKDIVRPLMEAATFIISNGASSQAVDSALGKIDRADLAPVLFDLAEKGDEELAAEAASTLGIFSPDGDSWAELMRLWRQEQRPFVMLGLMQAAFAWPAWRAGGFYLDIVKGGEYPLARRRDALEYAKKKRVPGLGLTALGLLASGSAPDLVEELFEALVLHLQRAGDLDEELRELDREGGTGREILIHALEELERLKEEEQERE